MTDEKTGYPLQQPYPPVNPGYPTGDAAYPPQPQPYGGAPPPYYHPPPQGGPEGQPLQTVGVAPQQPGQTVIIRQTQVQPNDYLGFAIFVTICCCLPFGIVGIVKASEVRSRFSAGDYQGAEESSRSAKNWSCAGLVTGLILIGSFFVFYVLLYVIILGAALSSY
ncbi:Proline-rich transmembrane protein 1 [Holothuria leucospilota]|uniref:Proline-rich transmembrane protein 1 n=1 Tax=Holothuria leucospilota TaxID=206669 RepID=A0A9Q1CSY9_HOLLE|nr:Proline-rich transmembrane protein 1 [Holothuria leucospilota]